MTSFIRSNTFAMCFLYVWSRILGPLVEQRLGVPHWVAQGDMVGLEPGSREAEIKVDQVEAMTMKQ